MRRATILCSLALASCWERAEPPGAEARPLTLTVAAASAAPLPKRALPTRTAPPGTIEDNLPFAPTGERAASIAWRTWIYTDVGPQRTRYGYLRAGAVVDVRGPPIKNDGCDGGWYRVNPRGFICLGLGATLELDHPVAVAAAKRAVRGERLPYAYALSADPAPLLYFRLPTAREMHDSEQVDIANRGAIALERIQRLGIQALFPGGEPPPFLANGAKLKKPHGVKQPLRYAYHAGQASVDSGFAFTHTFDWEERRFGLTTELDIVALDRTKPVVPSEFHGVALVEGEDLPVGFAMGGGQRYTLHPDNLLYAGSSLGRREPVKL
ncbi:MAG TPA: L,D-transpeptidase, partial [Polyangiaceae bacterium]|nr:L,D-transpeptidase [Polyangiaceae bacterium]